MNNPIELLIQEHDIILKAIDSAKKISSTKNINPEAYQSNSKKMIEFFRNYADKYHHNKEETLLFPAMCDENTILKDGIIGEMMDNHAKFRNDLNEIEADLKRSELDSANRRIIKYLNELLDHISIENDEVFQIAGALLSKDELEKIYFGFIDIDRELGMAAKSELELLV